MPNRYPTKAKTLPKYLAKPIVDSILSKAREKSTWDYLVLTTLWRTGMRESDLVKVVKRDLKPGEITVRQGKGNKDRLIPIDGGLFDLLTLHSASMGLDERLFPISEARVRQICYKYRGEEGLHPHMLRHSYAVHCLKSGVNIRTLQKMLGHKDLNTTAVYLDLIADDLKEEHRKVSW
jgi:site-specific recombinase XerD